MYRDDDNVSDINRTDTSAERINCIATIVRRPVRSLERYHFLVVSFRSKNVLRCRTVCSQEVDVTMKLRLSS